MAIARTKGPARMGKPSLPFILWYKRAHPSYTRTRVNVYGLWEIVPVYFKPMVNENVAWIYFVSSGPLKYCYNFKLLVIEGRAGHGKCPRMASAGAVTFVT